MNFTLFKNVSNFWHNGFGVTYNELVDTLDAVGVPSTSRFDHFPPHGPHQQIHRSDPPKQFGRHRSETRLISQPFLLCFWISCASGIYHQFSLGNPPPHAFTISLLPHNSLSHHPHFLSSALPSKLV